MKKLIFITLLSLLAVSGWGQNYVRLGDASGYDDGIYDDSLEIASTELINILSNDIQSAFKVFDVGYYLYNSQVNGPNELDSLWIKTKEHITSSHPDISYYILFGRVVYASGKIEIKVEVVLPDTDIFYCIDNISPGFRKEIENQVRSKANGLLNPQNIFINEIKAIKQLKYIIQNKICCDPEGSGLRFVSCDACMIDTSDCHIGIDGRKIYPSFKEYERLDQLNFVIEAVKIINDEEYFIPADNSAFQGYENQGTRNASPIDCTIQFRDDVISSVDALKDTIINVTTSFNVYTYKYPRDCGSFEKKWNDYLADPGPALFIALINADRQNGFIAYHFRCCGSSVKEQNGTRSPGAGNPTYDDLQGMREALTDSGGTCHNIIIALSYNFDYTVDRFLAKIYLSDEQYKLYEDYYENKKQRVKNNLTEAKKEYFYYFELEYHIQKKKFERYDWTSHIVSHYNLCAEVIHGILDFCGVIEPLGIICDGTNAVLYTFKGDLKNASLSAAATIPVIGTASIPAKIAGKAQKIGSFQVNLQFKRLTNGAVRFVGGANKLKAEMIKFGLGTNFAGIYRNVIDPLTEAHHIIPSELFTNLNAQLPIFKKMARMGWHAGDPWMNGLVLPKYCKNASTTFTNINPVTFHSNHPKYNEWIIDALNKIDVISNDDVLINITKLESHIIKHLENAWNSNKSINQYFNELCNLPYNAGFLDINKL